MNRISSQTVGNIGLYYVSYRLSRLGWNVMPTTRNARGVDLLIYSQDAKRKLSIQVKTLSKANPVPCGCDLNSFFADYVIVCRNVDSENPECFILTSDEVKNLAHRREKDGKVSYWLQPKQYQEQSFREAWKRIGSGYGG